MPAARPAVCNCSWFNPLCDPERPEWLPKTHFIMLMRDEKLAQLQTHFDAESAVLAITKTDRVLMHARMTDPEGCKLVGEFFRNFFGDSADGPLRVESRMRRRTNTCR